MWDLNLQPKIKWVMCFTDWPHKVPLESYIFTFIIPKYSLASYKHTHTQTTHIPYKYPIPQQPALNDFALCLNQWFLWELQKALVDILSSHHLPLLFLLSPQLRGLSSLFQML